MESLFDIAVLVQDEAVPTQFQFYEHLARIERGQAYSDVLFPPTDAEIFKRGGFSCEIQVYSESVKSALNLTVDYRSKKTSIGQDASEPLHRSGIIELESYLYFWSIEDSAPGRRRWKIYRDEKGPDDEVFSFEYASSELPQIAVLVFRNIEKDISLEPTDITASTALKIEMQLQNETITRTTFIHSWKSFLLPYPSMDDALFYRLPNFSGLKQVNRYALVDPQSIRSGDGGSFAISKSTLTFDEMFKGEFNTLKLWPEIKSQAVVYRTEQVNVGTLRFFMPLESVPRLTFPEKVVRATFSDTLTPMGEASLASLHKFVRDSADAWKGGKVFAPMTSVAQSSGLGKSKLAYELLKSVPGIYFVFRGVGDTGFPQTNPWSAHLKKSLFGPNIPDDSRDKVMSSRVGYFLTYIKCMIEVYAAELKAAFQKAAGSVSVSSIIRSLASSQIAGRVSAFESINFENGKSVALPFEETVESIKDTIDDLYKTLSIDRKDPFLLVFDELSILEAPAVNCLNGFHIIRRALHCLESTCNTLALALGTNSSLIEFQKEATSDSYRTLTRTDFLPPFVPGFNYDVLWGYVYESQKSLAKFDFSRVKVDKDLLLNPRYDQFLASLGRPLWSSVALSELKTLAEEKLKNGHLASGESILAMWAIRAGIYINPAHKVAKVMVKSILATCFHSTTDGSELLIGYPSDPVLASAARSITNAFESPQRLFEGLLKFYDSGAVDTGQLAESIVAMLILRALDANLDKCEKMSHNGDVEGLGNLNNPRNVIFDTASDGAQSAAGSGSESASMQADGVASTPPSDFILNGIARVWTVKTFLEVLYGEAAVKTLISKGLVSNTLLKGLINVSHFVPTQKNYFWGDQVPSSLPQNIFNNRYTANSIDHEMLRWALMRQAGFFVPSRYYGIDLVVPVCLPNGVLTYISIQVKTGTTCVEHSQFVAFMEPMLPGLHYIACPRHRTSTKGCRTCEKGDADLETICGNHLGLIVCLDHEILSLRAYQKEVQLGENLYCRQVVKTLSVAPRANLKHNVVTFIGSFGEAALLPARDPTVKAAIRGLLSSRRNIFTSRQGSSGFNRLLDIMQYVPGMYPEAYAPLNRNRGRQTARLRDNAKEYLRTSSGTGSGGEGQRTGEEMDEDPSDSTVGVDDVDVSCVYASELNTLDLLFYDEVGYKRKFYEEKQTNSITSDLISKVSLSGREAAEEDSASKRFKA